MFWTRLARSSAGVIVCRQVTVVDAPTASAPTVGVTSHFGSVKVTLLKATLPVFVMVNE